MIGIKAISSYLPEQRVDNIERASALGSSEDQVRDRIGFCSVAKLSEDETTLGMARTALERLLEEHNVSVDSIEVLIVVGQNPDRNIPHLSAELHGEVGLNKECACFDIGLGCSGYVYGISIIQSFMQANGLTKGILVTADPYSRIVDPSDKATALIFGDGATATLFDDSPVFTIGKSKFGTDGTGAEKLKIDNGTLFMNGRAVFNFAATHIPKHINEVISFNGLEPGDIDYYLVHQGSRFIVETIADRLKVSRNIVPFDAQNYGNTISSSIPFMLQKVLSKQTQYKHIVLSGFGLGLSWATTIINREE